MYVFDVAAARRPGFVLSKDAATSSLWWKLMCAQILVNPGPLSFIFLRHASYDNIKYFRSLCWKKRAASRLAFYCDIDKVNRSDLQQVLQLRDENKNVKVSTEVGESAATLVLTHGAFKNVISATLNGQ